MKKLFFIAAFCLLSTLTFSQTWISDGESMGSIRAKFNHFKVSYDSLLSVMNSVLTWVNSHDTVHLADESNFVNVGRYNEPTRGADTTNKRISLIRGHSPVAQLKMKVNGDFLAERSCSSSGIFSDIPSGTSFLTCMSPMVSALCLENDLGHNNYVAVWDGLIDFFSDGKEVFSLSPTQILSGTGMSFDGIDNLGTKSFSTNYRISTDDLSDDTVHSMDQIIRIIDKAETSSLLFLPGGSVGRIVEVSVSPQSNDGIVTFYRAEGVEKFIDGSQHECESIDTGGRPMYYKFVWTGEAWQNILMITCDESCPQKDLPPFNPPLQH